jgi:hypothetical protein
MKSYQEVKSEAIALYGDSINVLPKGRNVFASHAQSMPSYLGEIQAGEGHTYLIYAK